MAAWNVYRARRAEREHPPAGRFLTVNGIRLHLMENGGGRPIVLLHGNGATAEDFLLSGVFDLAARQYRVLAIDRPGFGYSERPFGVWSPARQAELLRHALLDLGIEPAIVIGHSWGTLVALALALDFPEAVGGLVLLSGYYCPTVRFEVPLFSASAIPIVGDLLRYTITPPLTKAMMPALIERCFSPLPVPERFANSFPVGLAVRPSQIRAEAQDTATMVSAAAAMRCRYSELHMPIAIMAGTEDRIVSHRRHAIWLSARISQSTLRLVPGVGHMVHYAVPEQIVEAIGVIADRADAARGRAVSSSAVAIPAD